MDSRRNTDPLPIFLKRLMKARGMTVGKLWLAAGLKGPSGVYRYLSGERGGRVDPRPKRRRDRYAGAPAEEEQVIAGDPQRPSG